MAAKILIGTSSWADPGFVEEWYPKGLPARDRLHWYSERFPVVEVNSSFYAVPERTTVGRWVGQTPDHFVFAPTALVVRAPLFAVGGQTDFNLGTHMTGDEEVFTPNRSMGFNLRTECFNLPLLVGDPQSSIQSLRLA